MQSKTFENFIIIIMIGFLLTTSIRPSVQIFSIFLFLVLVSYYFYLKSKHSSIFSLTIDEKLLTLSFFLIALSGIPPMLVNDSLSLGFRELEISGKYLLFSLIILFLLKLKPKFNEKILFVTIGITSILNGLIAISHLYIWKDFLFQEGRVQAFTGVNEFGIICGVLTIFNIILLIYYAKNTKDKIFYLIATLLSMCATVGTGLRSVILAIGFSLLFIFIISIFQKNKTILKKMIIMIIFLILTAIVIFISMPTDRIKYTKEEFTSIKSGNFNTSIGLRLIMYKEALAMFKISPLIGLSAKSTIDNQDKIMEISKTTKMKEAENKINDARGKKHNEILTFMAKRGLIGLFSLLFFYFMVLKIFAKDMDVIGIMGIGLMLIYIGTGFSGDPLLGNPESTFFALMLGFLLLCKKRKLI